MMMTQPEPRRREPNDPLHYLEVLVVIVIVAISSWIAITHVLDQPQEQTLRHGIRHFFSAGLQKDTARIP